MKTTTNSQKHAIAIICFFLAIINGSLFVLGMFKICKAIYPLLTNHINQTAEETNKNLESILPQTGGPYSSYVGHLTSRKNFLVYQPSGGFTNQKKCLSNAIKLAIAYDRVLVVPMIGKHSNFWEYHDLNERDLIEADRIFDFDKFLKESKLKGIIVLREPFRVFLESLRERFGNRIEEYAVGGTNDNDRYSQRKYLAQMINKNKIPNEKKVLLFSGYAMFNNYLTIAKTRLNPELVYTPSIQKMAMDLVRPLGMYHSIHVRLGDYYNSVNDVIPSKSDISLCCNVTDLYKFWVKDPTEHTEIRWDGGPNADYPSESHQRPNLTSPIPTDVNTLYVATNPSSPRDYFKPLCQEKKFNCYFSSDLDGDIMSRFYDAFGPDRKNLANDVFGVVEQVMCANSLFYISTLSRSTFSKEIKSIRQFWPSDVWELDPKMEAESGDHDGNITEDIYPDKNFTKNGTKQTEMERKR